MNVKLLRKVQKHIASEPKRFTFDWMHESDAAPCGTRACIAGWTLILGTPGWSNKTIDEIDTLLARRSKSGFGFYTGPASKLLDINYEQAARLFIYWPEPFDELKSADTAVARIEHFIKTKGRE